MKSVAEAREQLLALVPEARVETVSLDEALGRVPASRTIRASADVPPFANSAMDGFAVRAADLPGRLEIRGEVAAGASEWLTVEPGTAVRISTGAPLPPGADTVVPMERTTEADGRVEVGESVPIGADVRVAGHDTHAGDEVSLPAPLTPAGIGVLASLGMPEVAVLARPVVAILSSGAELVAPGDPLGRGQIHDANAPALAAAVREAGGEPRVLPRVGDDPAAVRAALAAAVRDADLVLTSGGVSVGAHDHVRDAIGDLGRLDFWRIAVQPGQAARRGRGGGHARWLASPATRSAPWS